MQTALNRFEWRTLYNTDPSELLASLPTLATYLLVRIQKQHGLKPQFQHGLEMSMESGNVAPVWNHNWSARREKTTTKWKVRLVPVWGGSGKYGKGLPCDTLYWPSPTLPPSPIDERNPYPEHNRHREVFQKHPALQRTSLRQLSRNPQETRHSELPNNSWPLQLSLEWEWICSSGKTKPREVNFW